MPTRPRSLQSAPDTARSGQHRLPLPAVRVVPEDAPWRPGSQEPVTATMLARETGRILDALVETNRPIMVARHGVHVATLKPVSRMEAAELLDGGAPELTARELNRDGAGKWIRHASGGGSAVLTRLHVPLAVLGPPELPDSPALREALETADAVFVDMERAAKSGVPKSGVPKRGVPKRGVKTFTVRSRAR